MTGLKVGSEHVCGGSVFLMKMRSGKKTATRRHGPDRPPAETLIRENVFRICQLPRGYACSFVAVSQPFQTGSLHVEGPVYICVHQPERNIDGASSGAPRNVDSSSDFARGRLPS